MAAYRLPQPGSTKILPVPYFIQPTSYTCQSTCLKMMASYLDSKGLTGFGMGAQCVAGGYEIMDIFNEINGSPSRPDKAHRNSHANILWWLESHYPGISWARLGNLDIDHAIAKIVEFINGRIPVMASVSHSRTKGHFILLVGYENYNHLQCADYTILAHDPYGKFDPSLASHFYGRCRSHDPVERACVTSDSGAGPGKFVRLRLTRTRRNRPGRWGFGTHCLISGALGSA